MGSRTRALHRKKFMGGRMTPQEVHAQLAFPLDAKCAGCGRRPTIRAITMCELSEARKDPGIEAIFQENPAAVVQRVVMLKGSDGKAIPYLRMGIAYSCASCRPTMERTLAKAPSHWVVEINDGPAEEKVITS